MFVQSVETSKVKNYTTLTMGKGGSSKSHMYSVNSSVGLVTTN